jgi:CheY-like chemotaxis protein
VARARKLVVVIEDEPDLLEVTSFVLESEGFSVQAARNGEEGLELLRSGTRPGLVLLDMRMPVMSGPEFMREIAKYPALHAIPIVVLTADGTSQVPGAVAVLHKPIDLAQLVEVVERHA